MSDLDTMSLEDLKALQKEVEQAIKTYQVRKLEKARPILEEKARELGVSLEELFEMKSKRKTTAAAKYRHPEDKSLTWTGRGRVPKWLVEYEAQGGNRADLLIS